MTEDQAWQWVLWDLSRVPDCWLWPLLHGQWRNFWWEVQQMEHWWFHWKVWLAACWREAV